MGDPGFDGSGCAGGCTGCSYIPDGLLGCADLGLGAVASGDGYLSEDFSDGAVIEGARFVNPLADSFDLKHWI